MVVNKLIGVTEDNIIYPIKITKNYIRHSLNEKELLEPFSVLKKIYPLLKINKDGEEKLQSISQALFGLKALEIQAKKKQYEVKPINWDEWKINGEEWRNMHLTVRKKTTGSHEERWQVKSTFPGSQFLMLRDVFYDNDYRFIKINQYFDEPIDYQKFFVEWIDVDLKRLKKELVKSEPSLSSLGIEYLDAFYISKEDVCKLAYITPDNWFLKTNIHSEAAPREIKEKYRITSLSNMTKF